MNMLLFFLLILVGLTHQQQNKLDFRFVNKPDECDYKNSQYYDASSLTCKICPSDSFSIDSNL